MLNSVVKVVQITVYGLSKVEWLRMKPHFKSLYITYFVGTNGCQDWEQVINCFGFVFCISVYSLHQLHLFHWLLTIVNYKYLILIGS